MTNLTAEDSSNQKAPRIAFIGWNPFQMIHVASIARRLPGACYVIEKRKNHLKKFSDELLTGMGVPVIIWHRGKIDELDGVFDVIVCQTPFSQMHKIKKTKIVMIQYGYAKEVHNYSKWRAFADLCLVYGEYAANKIRPFCPVEIVGNPSLDRWHDPKFIVSCQKKYGELLDPSKKTILYVPTWGPLSTYNKFIDTVIQLGNEYNVLLKLHHNTDMLDKKRKKKSSNSNIASFGANDELIALLPLCDIVLSDYSGAIFDALYCEKPLVLLQGNIDKLTGNKINHESLEHKKRDQIGPVVTSPGQLGAKISAILEGKICYTDKNRTLVTDLYVKGPSSTERCVEAIETFIRKGISLTPEEQNKKQAHKVAYLNNKKRGLV